MRNNTPQHIIEQLTAATTRALSHDKATHVSFQRGNNGKDRVDYEQHRITLPTPTPPLPESALQRFRGEADAAALSLRYHNPALHAAHRPSGVTAQDIFDAAEQARVEALGSRVMRGVAENLHARLSFYCLQEGYDMMTAKEDAPLADVIALLIRERLTGRAAPRTAEALMTRWGSWVSGKIQTELEQLAESAADQEAFSHVLRQLLKTLQLEEAPSDYEPDEEGKYEMPESMEQEPQANAEEDEAMPLPGHPSTTSTGVASATLPPQPMMAIDDEGEEESSEIETLNPTPPPAHNQEPVGFHYAIYTTEFDEIVRAEEMCPAEELTRLRHQLDMKLSLLKTVATRSANRLQRMLLSRQQRTLELHQEEGLLDSTKLPHLIADPLYPLAYRWERVEDQYNTVVTLLIDNSGSMRGRPITVAAMSADILARTLERCGIKVEILGFTSCDWKGGKSKKKWLDNGSPPHPGRLSDLRHVIYKSADQPWRRARKNLGLMLREGLLKENIDGEAILWAHSRLQARPEQRRILMIISDGSPVDEGTLAANGNDYLEHHLREVIHHIETHSDVELLAIGIGHDVTRYYKHAVTIREVDQLSDTMFKELSELLGVGR